jgi:predicted nucleic acid-binding protein
MSGEFVDTNIFIYAHDGGAGDKHRKSVELVSRLFEERLGVVSIQVLSEFYVAATRKLGINPQEVEEIIADLGVWAIHRPTHGDLIHASRLHRRYQLAWWDALILNSAIESGCSIIWSEAFSADQCYGTVTARNPFT